MQIKNTTKRSKIPYIFFAFFGVVIAVNIGYIYIAKKTWRGVVTEDSYQKGLNYNDTLKQIEKQKELGWLVEIKPTNIGRNKMEILVKVSGNKSSLGEDTNVMITFTRPTQEGFDFIVSDTSKYTHRFDVTFPLPGQWDAVIMISQGQDKLYLTRHYVVQ